MLSIKVKLFGQAARTLTKSTKCICRCHVGGVTCRTSCLIPIQTVFRRCQTNTASSRKSSATFKVLAVDVDKESSTFTQNEANYGKLLEQLHKADEIVNAGGGEKAIQRHTLKNKKLLVADRLHRLFDDYDSVLEIGKHAGLGMPYGNIARAGQVCAIGKIQGIYCIVTANDATVKAGTVYPITVKKQLRCQEISQQNFLPPIYMVDSGGAFLPLQAEIFPESGGRTFYNEAIMNSLGIPQLAIVVGSCTAGAAYIPTMVQESAMVHKISTIFLGGPPLVKAATGELVSPEDLGGATLHSSVSGCTDYFAGTEDEVFETSRDVVSTFNIAACESDAAVVEAPAYDATEISGIIPSQNQDKMDIYQVIARIVDGSRFHEFKKRFGATIVTGFSHINGHLVGVIGSHGELSEKAALKGAHFVQLCDQRRVPIIFLQNTAPADLTVSTEEEAEARGGQIRAHAKMMAAVACSRVPKVTVIIGNAIGTDNYVMGGRAFNPHFTFAWPNAQIGIQPPRQLADTLTQMLLASKKDLDVKACEELAANTAAQVAQQSSALYGAGNLWHDGIIMPHDTRKVLSQCLGVFSQQASLHSQEQTQYSVMRM